MTAPRTPEDVAAIAGRLTALADRCEAASGPDRELDASLALACGIVRERDGNCFYGHRDHSVLVLERGYYDHDGNAPELSAYTSSTDAAMSLAPMPSTRWFVDGPLGSDASVDHGNLPRTRGRAATPALAICAAALRARAHLDNPPARTDTP